MAKQDLTPSLPFLDPISSSTLDYASLAVFGLQALFLVIRPQGLLGPRESTRPRPV
jgi:branched-subunit amino acid ABC-type transport system permease component